jgi:hypothetical protein
MAVEIESRGSKHGELERIRFFNLSIHGHSIVDRYRVDRIYFVGDYISCDATLASYTRNEAYWT